MHNMALCVRGKQAIHIIACGASSLGSAGSLLFLVVRRWLSGVEESANFLHACVSWYSHMTTSFLTKRHIMHNIIIDLHTKSCMKLVHRHFICSLQILYLISYRYINYYFTIIIILSLSIIIIQTLACAPICFICNQLVCMNLHHMQSCWYNDFLKFVPVAFSK